MKALTVLMTLFLVSVAAQAEEAAPLASPPVAMLPPLAQSLRKIQAIATSPEVYDALGSVQWVKSISQNEDGSYTVMARDCALTAKVEPVLTSEPHMVPALKVTVGPVNCLPGHRE